MSMLQGKKLVVATDSRVWSPGEGRNYRFRELIRGFRCLGLSVDLVTGRSAIPATDTESLVAMGIARIVTRSAPPHAALHRKIAGRIASRLHGAWKSLRGSRISNATASPAMRITAHRTPELRTVLAEYLLQQRPDYLLVSYLVNWDCTNALAVLPPEKRPITMIDTNDVLADRCAALADRGAKVPVGCSRSEEGPLLDLFDIVISIHDEDAAIFRSMVRSAAVVTCLPAGPQLPAGETSLPPDTDPSVIYVAGDSPANRDGLHDFLAHCWPAILRACPHASLKVAGKVGEALRETNFPNVHPLGFVSDLSALYQSAALVISPVSYGGGLKIKVLEGLAHGRPVVATQHSAIGLSAAAGKGLTVAADWPSFTAAVTELILDSGRRASEALAAAATAREFTPDRVIEGLGQAMADASSRRKPSAA
jgi:glycosyltransferase involved in cell wall biosynthesis